MPGDRKDHFAFPLEIAPNAQRFDAHGVRIQGSKRLIAPKPVKEHVFRPGKRFLTAQLTAPVRGKTAELLPSVVYLPPKPHGIRTFAPSTSSEYSLNSTSRRFVLDDRFEGLLRRDRPALELSVDVAMGRKGRKVDIAGFTQTSNANLISPTPLRQKPEDSWKTFLPETSRPPLKSYRQVVQERLNEEDAEEVLHLKQWELKVLKKKVNDLEIVSDSDAE